MEDVICMEMSRLVLPCICARADNLISSTIKHALRTNPVFQPGLGIFSSFSLRAAGRE
jgi:hypothetical protein